MGEITLGDAQHLNRHERRNLAAVNRKAPISGVSEPDKRCDHCHSGRALHCKPICPMAVAHRHECTFCGRWKSPGDEHVMIR